ncbi:MAG: hypothetical protein K2O69_00520, partial [Odoribacter sp.]|nr:hypothetical protein [Odoribacter sp.]
DVDYQSLLCADGKLQAPQVTVSRNMESGAFSFVPKQLSRYGKRSLASDKLYALIAEKSARDGFIAELGSREEGRETEVTIPQEWNPEEIVIYVFATDETGRKASKSAYVVPTEA